MEINYGIMNTTDIFKFKRFGRYFASDLKGCASSYGLSMALISLTGVITYVIAGLMGTIVTGTWSGTELGFRLMVFAIAMFVLVTSMPVKCYGSLTDKRFGAEWVMIPVSQFEKFLSMILMTVIIAPVVTGGIYILTDLLLCSLDPTCGQSLAGAAKGLVTLLIDSELAEESDMITMPALVSFTRQIADPWLYIDDAIMICLIFLLGAICFKSNKTAKTILAFIVYSIALSIILTPVMSLIFKSMIPGFSNINSTEGINLLFSSGLFRHAALIDTISDTLTNLGLLIAIFFRIKTLKH